MSYTIEKLCELGMPIAMAALVEAANRRETITYKDITERIEPTLGSPIVDIHIGWVVGSMMNKIHENDQTAPPLHALCVNGTTKLPGDGAHDWINRRGPDIMRFWRGIDQAGRPARVVRSDSKNPGVPYVRLSGEERT